MKGGVLLHDDVDDLDAVEVTTAAQELFHAVVVFRIVHYETDVYIVPASEGARRLAYILLAVIADAHGK